MEKEALLKIILHDVKELETLLSTFTGKPEIPKTFINLAKSKANGILEELNLLEELAVSSVTTTSAPAPRQHSLPADPEPIIESKLNSEITSPPITTPQTITAPDIPDVLPQPEAIPPNPTEQKEIPLPEPTVVHKHHEKKHEPDRESQPAILADKLGRDTLSFNEKLAQKKDNDPAPRYQNKPIDDLKKGIGINDRFYFQRELFNGNAELLNQTLEQLNQLENFESAETFLATNFNWENNNEAVKAFRELVRRRYL